MTRVSFFIDGFNLYHSLKENARDCRWLNLRKLCESYISKEKGEVIENIYYFSAYAHWITPKKPEKVAKHKKYVARLLQEDITPVLGKFKQKEKECPICRNKYLSHEEKQTDVNIALKLVTDAFQDKYDTAILVSGDTDMIPAIKVVHDMGWNKKVGVLFPLKRKTNELNNEADFSIVMKRELLYECLFELDTAPEGWVPTSSDQNNNG